MQQTRSGKISLPWGRLGRSDGIWTVTTMLAMICLLQGCLSRPSLTKQYFAFSGPPFTPVASSPNGRILEVRRVTVAAPFAGQAFVYRTGGFSYERDPYAGFLVPPDENLSETAREYLRASGVFCAVTNPGSVLKPNIAAEISFEQLYGDFRNPATPLAVVRVRLSLLDTPEGKPEKLLLDHEYRRQVPLKERTAAALMNGWDQALAQMMRDVVADLEPASHPQRAN